VNGRGAPAAGRVAWWLVPLVLVGAWGAWAVFEVPAEAPPAPIAAAPDPPARPSPAPPQAATQRPPSSAEGERVRQEQLALWQKRLDLAQTTLDDYRQATRYPPGSQPLALHADQAFPNQPVEEERPLAAPGTKGDAKAVLRTSQERVFVQGEESVRFTVSARDAAGAALPLRVVRASAAELSPPNTGSLYPVVPLSLNDEGSQGDAVAGDGTFSVQLQPKTAGFGGLFGQIRVEAVLQVQGEQGVAAFDVFYTPEPPAVWNGGVREALEDGSLHFFLKAKVQEAGRYVVKARVDDANGVPFALLGFNDEVPQGDQEFRMTLFGKLVRDGQPAFPLVVRDVDAFLLRPDAFPDRSLMPRLAGKVHASQEYAVAGFADAEWSSEERTRYLTELGRDVEIAKEQVERLGR